MKHEQQFNQMKELPVTQSTKTCHLTKTQEQPANQETNRLTKKRGRKQNFPRRSS